MRAYFPPEPAVSGVLAQSHSGFFSHITTLSLLRGCSGMEKVGARTSKPHFGRSPKPTCLRLTSPSGGEKTHKTSDLPLPLGCAAQGSRRAQDSVPRPGHRLGDLRLSPVRRTERLTVRQAFGHPGRPGKIWGAFILSYLRATPIPILPLAGLFLLPPVLPQCPRRPEGPSPVYPTQLT